MTAMAFVLIIGNAERCRSGKQAASYHDPRCVRNLDESAKFHNMNHMDSRPALAAVCIPLLLLCACDGGTSLRGYVRDTHGHPIVGASITMRPDYEDRRHEVHSGDDGAYSITMLHEPRHSVVVTVSKQGYAQVERRFRSKGEAIRQDFTLLPKN